MQSKVLAIHDLSCFGRSSLVPIIAVLSAAGHQCVPLPTALFSTHMALDGWCATDLTGAMPLAIAQYQALGLQFEAVYAGFLNSAGQITCVCDAVRRLRAADGLTLIDPVMGDNGKQYATFTPALCDKMRELCSLADIITPNVTEAAILLDESPEARPADEKAVWEWLRALRTRYGAAVVLTGLQIEAGKVGTACLSDAGGEISLHARIDCYFPGTGDLFASVMLGKLLRGVPLPKAAADAGLFVRDCIADTVERGTNPLYGVQFERQLGSLM